MSKWPSVGTRWYACATIMLLSLWSRNGSLAGTTATSAEASALVDKTRPALLLLVSLDRHGKAKTFGTGFFIRRDGILVTARHVAQAEQNLVALTQDGKKLPVTGFIGEDRDCDITVLKAQASECPHLTLAEQAQLETNEWAALVSAQDYVAPACSTGVIESITCLPGLFTAIRTTIPVQEGQSGSPLLNAKGEVIGVVPYYSPTHSAIASPVATVKEIIARDGTHPPMPFSKRPSNGSNLPLLFDPDFRPAIDAFQRSDWLDAQRLLKRVAKRFPESPLTFTLLALVQMRDSQIGRALRSAERACQLSPDTAMPCLLKGVCLVTQGRPSEGLTLLRTALRIGLSDHYMTTSAWELVARVEEAQGHNQQAEEALIILERLDPKMAEDLRRQIDRNKTKGGGRGEMEIRTF